MEGDPKLNLDDTLASDVQSSLESTVASRELSGGPAPARATPERAGRYLIIEEIGSGAMGTVYAAYDPQLDRKIALKLLRPERGADREFCARMLREAQALAKLSHPHVVAVYDAGTFGDQVFIAMDFIQGTSLRQWLGARRPWREIVDMFLQAGRGLAAAHAAGLVHRDFKPDNVLVGDDGRARVVDFGLAAETEVPVALGASTATLTTTEERLHMAQGSLTRVGALLGTPAYMAPEQLMGQPARTASDQFSYCVALWEALYGERPFVGKHLDALIDAILRGKPGEGPRRTRVPPRVRRVLLKGLSARPELRHPDMSALLAALARAAARPWRRWAALGAVALAGVLGFAVFDLQRQQADMEARLAALATTRAAACAAGEAQLAGFWDAGRAQAIERGFAATGLAFAPHDAAQATALLGRYADGWAETYRGLCLAHQRGELPDDLHERGLACLYERRAALGSLAELLAEADRAIVERSSEAIGALPGTTACSDPAQLLREGEAAATPEAAQARERLRRELAQIVSQSTLRTDDALRERLARVIEAARAAGDAALQARALRSRAVFELDQDAFDAALASLRESWWLALAAEADREALVSARRLARELATHGRIDEGEVWLRNGQALLARLGAASTEDAILLAEVEGLIAMRRGQLAAALAILEPLRARVEREFGETHPQHVQLLVNISGLREDLGDYAGSIAGLRRGLAIREAIYGTDHPKLIVTLENLGVSLDNVGEFAAAQASYRRALDLARRFMPESPLKSANLRNNLGESLYREGEHAAALAEFVAARDTMRASGFREHPLIGFTELGQGNALLHLGRVAEAEAAYAAAEAALRGLPARHPAHAYAKLGFARIALLRGRAGEARRLVEEAGALRTPETSSPAERAEVALLRAEILDRSPGARAEARRAAEAAVALYREAGPGYVRPLAEAEAWLLAHA